MDATPVRCQAIDLESNDRPNLLVLASTYPRWKGDSEPGFVHELCKRLVPHFKVRVVTSHSPGARECQLMDGVRVYRYRYAANRFQTLVYGGGIMENLRRAPWKLMLLPGFVFMQYWLARKLVRANGIRLIHAHWIIPQGLVARWLSRKKDVRYVLTSHGSDLRRLRRSAISRIKRRTIEECAAMTVVSRGLVQDIERLGVRRARVDVLPMGVDLRCRFSPDTASERSARDILFVGRLIRQKGLHVLLEALSMVIASHPDVRLSVAGDGPESDACRLQAERSGLVDRVQFLGAVPQERLPSLYQRAAITVVPSLVSEGLGLVAVEALGCACPVIASDFPSLRELLGNDTCGKLVPPGDARTLAVAMVNMLEQPVDHDVMHTVRTRLLKSHDWHAVAAGYANLLEDCLAGDSGRP